MAEEILETQNEVVEQVKAKTSKKETEKSFNFGALEAFYEKNKKAITYGGGAILAFVGIVGFYKLYWLPTQEAEAVNEAYIAQSYFEKDSFNVALNGGITVRTPEDPAKTMMGFKDIADNYGSTKTGNLANYYAGICLLRTGKFEEAIEYLEKYSGDDEMLAPVAVGAIGDANMELNKTDDAINYYLKAVSKSTNNFTTPYFLKKAALAYEIKGDYKEALGLYERIKNEYSSSTEAREVEKYIARANVLAGNVATSAATPVENAPATEELAGTLDANGNFIYNVGEATNIGLSTGKQLAVGKNSVEYKLFSFLSDAATTVDADKTKGWISLDRVYFENGKSTLTAESQTQLANIAEILKAFPNAKLKLGGYTDNTGSEATNVKISGERAKTALEAVVKNGVDAGRLKSEGYGPQHPIASNDTPEGKAQNRRVDIRVTEK